ncbi:tetratricopeptide repeat protein [Variovorax sp. J22R133]|uniref:tetratricopeptide repeat protein n=1 Tax=Variovorax brevis TaxID=3053503 RepID=UPI0025765B62|nr:tetratricopeptide repeat protein [Variovorax sp. J22R133]MDM0111013.1 tetratricopeptide repeat protein [Variovorax sp. J22R133]
MTAPSLDSTHPYTLRGIMQMLGLTRHAINGLIELGFVQPERAAGRAYRFSFRDVILLRTANELRAADIPTRQILKSLRQLKKALPQDASAGSFRIKAVGDRVAVRWGDAQWDADTGQLMMDFGVAPPAGSVHVIDAQPSQPASAKKDNPQALFAKAEALEEGDPKAAEKAYRRVIDAAPDYADAYTNLGFLLCESSRCEEAAALYAQAVVHCANDPFIHYNRAVALEALGRTQEAIDSYEACLRIAPDMADAHQNAALLYAQSGQKQLAIRHFSAYRRLQPRG